jgi:hypothetical protein
VKSFKNRLQHNVSLATSINSLKLCVGIFIFQYEHRMSRKGLRSNTFRRNVVCIKQSDLFIFIAYNFPTGRKKISFVLLIQRPYAGRNHWTTRETTIVSVYHAAAYFVIGRKRADTSHTCMSEARRRAPEASLMMLLEFAFGSTLRDFSSPPLEHYSSITLSASFENRGHLHYCSANDI